MELLLIRHAIPVRRELESGIADPELSSDGVKQAQLLADYLIDERIDALYASPMRRARQTAEPVAQRQRLRMELVDGVAEFDRTSSEYVPVEELKDSDDPRWRAMLRGEWPPREESLDEFGERVVGSIEDIIGRHEGQRVAIVCHGGVINAYLARVLGLGNREGFFYPNYTSIHRVAAARTGERSVVTVNETSHLRGSGLPMGLFQR
ncbi:MAG: histidine phosphatase family protein [Ilumatobacteraceae bacterium]